MAIVSCYYADVPTWRSRLGFVFVNDAFEVGISFSRFMSVSISIMLNIVENFTTVSHHSALDRNLSL